MWYLFLFPGLAYHVLALSNPVGWHFAPFTRDFAILYLAFGLSLSQSVTT